MIHIHINKDKIKCPTCGEPMVDAVAMTGGSCKNWMRCTRTRCCTFLNLAVPMSFQSIIMSDGSKELGIFGAYGSGKTFTSYQMDQKHILLTPYGETLIGADTLVQLDNTIRKDFEGDFPLEFVKSYNRQKNMVTFVNGHILYWRHLAEVDDIRSYNLTRAHILEASSVKHEAYIQLTTRVRNDRAIIYEKNTDGSPVMYYDSSERRWKKKERLNWIQLVTESNPDSGWINDDFLLKSEKVYVHFDKKQNYVMNPNEVRRRTNSHIIPTYANYNLPADFISNLIKNKPRWWVERFIEGSFMYSEGLVYKHWAENIIDDFPIPDEWPRIIGFDYGLNDNSHFVYGAVDKHGTHSGKPTIYFYKNLVKNDSSIKHLADLHKRELRQHVPKYNLFIPAMMDPVSYATRTRVGEKKTIGTLFREENCFFEPGQKNLNFRILHLNNFIDTGYVKFFKQGFAETNEEGIKYKYPERKLEKSKKDYKPEDKNNHGINAVEFVMSMIPTKFDSLDMGRVYSSESAVDKLRLKREWNPLSDDPVELLRETEGPGGLMW